MLSTLNWKVQWLSCEIFGISRHHNHIEKEPFICEPALALVVLEGYELEQTQSLTASRHLQCYPQEAWSYLFLLPSWVAFCRICVCLVARVANLVFRELLQPSRRLLFDASTHHRETFDCDAHKHSDVPFFCDAFLNFVCLLLILWGIY